MNDLCTCGHVLDEHDDSTFGKCTVTGCPCISFEPEEDDREE